MDTILKDKYRSALSRGRPRHEKCDDFSLKHPKMQLGQRAKIFAPFAALVGFEEAIEEKQRLYVEKRELNDEETEALERTLALLHEQTQSRRTVKEHPVTATVLYYVPCADENHEAYGCRGTYESISGIVWKVDTTLSKTLLIGDKEIELSDIAQITIHEEL